MGGERRPPDNPGEAEEHDRDGPRLPEEGGQAVAKKARGGVVVTAASFVSGIAASGVTAGWNQRLRVAAGVTSSGAPVTAGWNQRLRVAALFYTIVLRTQPNTL